MTTVHVNQHNDEFPIRLRAALHARKVSATELAERIGEDARSMEHFLKGEWHVYVPTLRRMSSVLDVSPAFLLGFTNHVDAEFRGGPDDPPVIWSD